MTHDTTPSSGVHLTSKDARSGARFAPLASALRDFSFSFIGIGLFRFWYQHNLYNLHSTTDYGLGVAWANILRGILYGLLLLTVLRASAPLTKHTRGMLVWSSLVLMTISSIISFFQLVTGDISFEVARFVTCGAGLVWGYGMWMDFFKRLSPPRVFLYLTMGLALSCFLSLLGGFLPPYIKGLLNLFVPTFAVLAYWYAMHTLDEREEPDTWRLNTAPVFSTTRHGDFTGVMVAFFIFTFVMGIALGFPDGDPRPLAQIPRSIHQIFLICVLLLLIYHVFVMGRSLQFFPVWCFLNILLIGGIILLSGDSDLAHTLSTALVLTAESFFYTFTFFTSYCISLRSKRSALAIFSILYGGTLFCMGVGRVLSTLIGLLPDGVMLMLVFMCTLMVVEMVISLRLGIKDHQNVLFGDIKRPNEPASITPVAYRVVPAAGIACHCSFKTSA